MDSQVEEFTDPNTPIVLKGKRTKRHRPSSPSAPTSSSSSGGGDAKFSSPTTSSEGELISTTTEEEEDMANCLILLAQGGGGGPPLRSAETASKASASATGIFVYECKTCNRTFPSFQALGGHRASHKRPKTEEKRVLNILNPSQEIDHHSNEESALNKNIIVTQLPNRAVNSKPKVHECSICGSEFSSGQALGGHMRRHRTIPNSQISTNLDSNIVEDQEEKPRHVFSLDLNLPAPMDDEYRREPEFQFPASQQRIVFSAPALVDCHY